MVEGPFYDQRDSNGECFKKIVVLGAKGQLGSEVVKACKKNRDWCVIGLAHEDLDITNVDRTFNVLIILAPDVVINCAALINVRRCEEQKSTAWLTNVEGVHNITKALACLVDRPFFVHVSTVCVFDGSDHDFFENSVDLLGPKNFYALTKLCGEQYALAYDDSVLVRTNIIDATQKWSYAKSFTDRKSRYLSMSACAKGIRDIVKLRMNGEKLPNQILHLCGKELLSMYELAKRLPEGDKVEPMTMSDYQGPPLTVNMRLASKHWKNYEWNEKVE